MKSDLTWQQKRVRLLNGLNRLNLESSVRAYLVNVPILNPTDNNQSNPRVSSRAAVVC